MVLILGGARSGKSSMAERMAAEAGGRVTFVATAEPRDEEMRQRIAAHRAARPKGWHTIEEALDLGRAVQEAVQRSDTVLVDCLTLWLSNHLCRLDLPESGEGWGPSLGWLGESLQEQISAALEAARSRNVTLLLVSNEVGLGLVPSTPLGRAYRDLLGAVNRRLAAEADRVLFMVGGLPVDVKRLAGG